MSIVALTLACLIQIQNDRGFPRETMFSLLRQENGREGASSRNSNGTYDHGPFQVNDVNVPIIAKQFGLSVEEAKARLRDDGCFNAQAAGYLLNEHWKRTGDIWTAIGHYHSRTEVHATRYRQQVYGKTVGLYDAAEGAKKRRKADAKPDDPAAGREGSATSP